MGDCRHGEIPNYPPNCTYLAGFFFAFFFGAGLGCGGDAHTRFNASSKGIGDLSGAGFALLIGELYA